MYSIEDYQNRLSKKYPDEQLQVVSFSKIKEKCRIKCLSCGTIYDFCSADYVVSKAVKHVCKRCHPYYKYTIDSLQRTLKEKSPFENFTVLSVDKVKDQCKIRCNDCGKIYCKTTDGFLTTKYVCYKCALKKYNNETQRKTNRKDTNEVGHKVSFLLQHTKNLTLLNSYVNITTHLQFRCNRCGQIFERMPQVFLKNQKCPACENPCKQRSEQSFINILKQKNNAYELIGKYTNVETPTLFRHKNCGFIFKTKPVNVEQGSPCPKCRRNTSMGENIIATFLNEHHILYKREKSFDDLPKLRFDFFLTDYNCVIEYQGEQHYFPINWFGGEKGFKKQQCRDNKKRKYCKDNHIQLIEIKYTEKNRINEIMAQRLHISE